MPIIQNFIYLENSNYNVLQPHVSTNLTIDVLGAYFMCLIQISMLGIIRAMVPVQPKAIASIVRILLFTVVVSTQ